MFKFIFVTLVIVAEIFNDASAISEEQQAQIQAKFVDVGSECIKKHPLTINDLASFKNRVFPDSDNAGCFSACVFNKIGLFDDKGALSHSIALENAKNVFEKQEELDSLGEFLSTCAKVNDEKVTDGEKGCERAKLAFVCFVENYEKLGFNIDF